MLTLCVLGYAGFFRFKELVHLRRCDFQFEDSFMSIFFIEVRLTFTGMGLGLLALKLSSIHVLIY